MLVLCLLIFVQSSYPVPDTGIEFTLSDKLVHFGVYGILAVLFFRNFQASAKNRSIATMAALSIACATLYGLSDEIHQAFVDHRQADLYDFLADFAGSIAGVFFYVVFVSRKSGLSPMQH